MTAPKRRWLWFGLTAALVAGGTSVALFAWYDGFYSPRRFSGDGNISDAGYWSYPRYSVNLPTISLSESGKHRFSFSGLPSGRMTFMLRTNGTGQSVPSGSVEVTLVDDTGQTVFRVSGPLSEWERAESQMAFEYWHPAARDQPIRNDRSYTLDVVVTGDSVSGAVVARPCLVGGGNELP
jgi:hypothetical protein